MKQQEDGNQPFRLHAPSGHESSGKASTKAGAPVPLENDSVSNIFRRDPVKASDQSTLGEIIQIMQDQKVGAVLLESDGKLTGLFTERDLIDHVLGESISLNTPIKDLVSSDPVYLRPTDEVGKAIRIMAAKGLRHLPVCGGEMEIIGILSVRRIIHSLAEHFPAEVINRPPRPGQSMRAAEGG